jgi:predicted Zn-dependent peptidase
MDSKIHPNRLNAPDLGKPLSLSIKAPEKVMLSNGVPVYLIRDEEQEVTRLDVVFEAGNALQDRKLQANAVNKLISEGTQNHTALEIAGIIDFYGAYLDPFISKDKAGLTLIALTKYYDKLLSLMAEILTKASFQKNEITLYEERKKQNFLVNIQKVSYRASLEFNKLIFGENSPYGQVLREDDFGKLQQEQVLDFYEKYYRPQNAYLMLSGKITDELLKKLEVVLGDLWRKDDRSVALKDNYTKTVSQKVNFLEKENALQSALRIGTTTLNRHHPDYPKLNLLNTVFGGYFGSRLMSSLREDKGYTYGVNSFIQNFKHANYMAVATEVNANHTAAAIREIKHQMELLSQEPVSQEELTVVKNYVYGSYLRYFDGPFSLADRFMKSLELDMEFGIYKKELDEMMQITPEELQKTARKYLNFDKMKILVVGKTEGLGEFM